MRNANMMTNKSDEVGSADFAQALQRLPTFMQALQREFVVHEPEQSAEIVQHTLAGLPLFVLRNPHHAEHVLRQKPSHYPKGVSQVANQEMVQRLRQMRPHFHRTHLSTLYERMIALIAAHLQQWAEDPAPRNLLNDLQRLAQELMVKSLFGFDLTPSEIKQAVESAHELARLAQGNPMPAALPAVQSPFQATAHSQFRQIVSQTLLRNRQQSEAGGEPDNLLAGLMAMGELDEIDMALAQSPIQEAEFSLLIDAAGNIASAIQHTLALLLAQPPAFTRLQAEIEIVLNDQTPTYAQLSELPYSKLVLREALRLHPPVSWLLRIASQDDQIADHFVPAGALIIIPIYLYQRDPVFWRDPEQFIPERFTQPIRHPLAWLPFGAGQRLCLGKDFSLLACQLILVQMVQRFEFANALVNTEEP